MHAALCISVNLLMGNKLAAPQAAANWTTRFSHTNHKPELTARQL